MLNSNVCVRAACRGINKHQDKSQEMATNTKVGWLDLLTFETFQFLSQVVFIPVFLVLQVFLRRRSRPEVMRKACFTGFDETRTFQRNASTVTHNMKNIPHTHSRALIWSKTRKRWLIIPKCSSPPVVVYLSPRSLIGTPHGGINEPEARELAALMKL